MADTMEFVKDLRTLARNWSVKSDLESPEERAALRYCVVSLEELIDAWGFVDPDEASRHFEDGSRDMSGDSRGTC